MSIEIQTFSLSHELSDIASWTRERTSEELQSFVGHRLALVAMMIEE